MKKLPIYLALLLLTQCSKCKDDPQPQPTDEQLSLLPPETQSGKHTFGCLINGVAFISPNTVTSNGEWFSLTGLSIGGEVKKNGDYREDSHSLSMVLNARRLIDSIQSFPIISSATPYPIFTPGVNQFWAFASAVPCLYDGKYFKSGRVELVKFDGVKRIAAGRFAFTLYEPGSCDTLRVTNGRFDIKF